jgi:hypothetical protein
MSRRRTKKAVKLQKNNSFTTLMKLEKDFFQTPKKLAAHLNKETALLKQKEAKLQKTLNKTQAQIKNSEKQIQLIAAKDKNQAQLKRLQSAKKIFSQSLNEQNQLSKQVEVIKNTLTNLLAIHNRFTALGKHLNQFQKDWANTSKNVKTKIINKPKAKHIIEDRPPMEPALSRPEEVRLDETTEVTS